MTFNRTIASLALTLSIVSMPALAEESRWDTGLRYTILVSQGEPSNDSEGIGVVGHYRWKDNWYFGFGVSQFGFDYENPAKVLNLLPASVEDGDFDMTQISTWLERRYGEADGKWSWFWNAGIGYGFIGTEDVAGLTTSGDPFLITTDASDEFQLLASLGVRFDITQHWRAEAVAHAQHHFTDYTLTDQVSGTTGTIGSHTPLGVSLGIAYRF